MTLTLFERRTSIAMTQLSRFTILSIMLPVVLGACFARGGLDTCGQTDSQSAIAWGNAYGAEGIKGRVFAARTLGPDTTAIVSMEPGAHMTRTDSTGAFAFPRIERGSYRISVVSPGGAPVVDTIPFGGKGVNMVVALGIHPPLVNCVITGSGWGR